MELLDDMVALLFLVFKGTSILLSILVTPIYILTYSVRRFPFLYTLHTLSSIYYLLDFLMMAILTGVR